MRGRRRFIAGGFGAAVLGLVGIAWQGRQRQDEGPGHVVPERDATKRTLLAFIAVLFGRQLTAEDRADLSDRLDWLLADRTLGRDCALLSVHLEELAQRRGGASFERCSQGQRESMVGEIMRIDYGSKLARLLQRVSRSERDYFRIRWSAVAQLSWMYRNSPVAWRARGYRRWPGVKGDWREVLTPGPAYP